MVDENAVMLALRNRMLTLVGPTTGSTSIAATATTYTRAAGSFITDGFAVGMELLASGFATAANNGYKIVTAVAAGTLTVSSPTTMVIEAAGGNETLAVGLPEGRAFDNVSFTPTAGRPFVEEDFVPVGHSLIAFPAQGGINDEDWLYIIKWYGLENKGTAGIRKPVQALKALFAPGTVVTAAGVPVRVRSDTSVRTSQILPQGTGWAVVVLTIPVRAESTNLVAV